MGPPVLGDSIYSWQREIYAFTEEAQAVTRSTSYLVLL